MAYSNGYTYAIEAHDGIFERIYVCDRIRHTEGGLDRRYDQLRVHGGQRGDKEELVPRQAAAAASFPDRTTMSGKFSRPPAEIATPGRPPISRPSYFCMSMSGHKSLTCGSLCASSTARGACHPESAVQMARSRQGRAALKFG